MKKIEAIIQPQKFEKVRLALTEAGYPGITLTEVKGHGKQKGSDRIWGGKNYKVEVLPKIKLEMVVVDAEAEKIVKVILGAAQTGQAGDGKVFVRRIDQAYKISSGEWGDGVVE